MIYIYCIREGLSPYPPPSSLMSVRLFYYSFITPIVPNMSLMINQEECTFVRAVCEAPTAQEAVELWNPRIKTTPAKKVKRLNNQSPRTPNEETSSRGGPEADLGAEEGSTDEAAVTAAGVAASAAVGVADIVAEERQAVDQRYSRRGFITIHGKIPIRPLIFSKRYFFPSTKILIRKKENSSFFGFFKIFDVNFKCFY